jgi:hypothetical protein
MKKKEQDMQTKISQLANSKEPIWKLKQFKTIDAKVASAQDRNKNKQQNIIQAEKTKAPASLPPIERTRNESVRKDEIYSSQQVLDGKYNEHLKREGQPSAPILMEKGPYKQIGNHYMKMYNQKHQHQYNSSEQISNNEPLLEY